ncbi:myo-inositol 2-dehydrogenase [Lasallia pustulata]|nr:myo-inositol 2-dehydrogenase [Lasallia pustulata]
MPTTQPPSPALAIAVAGLGRMGKRHVSTLIERVPRARVVAVCSTSADELAWAEENYRNAGIKIYDSYEAMIQHPGLQAVWMSTSTNVHAAQTQAAIERGLHVLCEKPLSADMEKAAHVVTVTNAHPEFKVMAGFFRRFDASYRDAKAKIEANTIGTPFLVRSQTCDLLDHTGFFVRYAKLNGGMFVDCCIHDIDLSLWFLGPNVIPKAVWAAGTIRHDPELASLNDVDNGVGIVEYWGGKLAYLYCSRTQAHGHDVCTEVVDTAGKIMPEYWERFEEAFATEAKEFVAAVLDHRPVPVALETGLMSLKIGWALQEALLTGERIRFDEEGNKLGGEGAKARL